jgi:dihydrofolate reductase
VPGVTFVTDLDSAVTASKEAAGDRYVNVLGAATARQCLEAGVLDEIFVCVAPVMRGTASACSTTRAAPTSSSNASA